MKMIKLTIFLLFLICSSLFSQFDTLWVRTINGTSNSYDGSLASATDNSGNIYACGVTVNSSTNTDMQVAKYSSSGVLLWSRTYNGTANAFDAANAMVIDNAGNIYVTGGVNYGSGFEMVTIRYNSSGDTAWVRRYRGTQNINDEANSIAIDSAGNIYVAGYSTNTGNSSDATVLKYSPTGVLLFARSYNSGPNQPDSWLDVKVDNSSNIYLAGRSGSTNSGNNFLIMKLNSTGDTVWSKVFNGSSNASDFAKKIRIDTSGNVYAAGYLDNTGSGTDIFVVKVSSAGVIQWTKTITGPGNDTDEPYGLEVDNSFNVYLACRTTVSGANTDIMTVKLNTSGDTSWVRKFGGTANTNDEPRGLKVDALGNVYTGGFVMNSNLDMALLRYSSSGLLTAQYILDKGPSDNINSLSINNTNEIIATGTINSDFGVVKFSQVFVGVNEISSPNKFVLKQNFPNPFNPQTDISYSIPNTGSVKIVIYDILGNEIESITKYHLLPGNYSFEWNAQNYPSGVYFYEMVAGGHSETRKMILLK